MMTPDTRERLIGYLLDHPGTLFTELQQKFHIDTADLTVLKQDGVVSVHGYLRNRAVYALPELVTDEADA
jgi:hypothetical protein